MNLLVLASNNAHKLEEVSRILEPLGIQVRPLAEFPDLPDPPETADTFEGNALEKARFVFERTGLATIADDSGLEVDALNGAPGVYSKRFTPEATAASNNARLLAELEGIPRRTARFVCALALVTNAGECTVRGTVEGEIGHTLKGEGGFGYDPLFLPNEAPGRAMAELTPTQKDEISHRGRALGALPEMLAALQSEP